MSQGIAERASRDSNSSCKLLGQRIFFDCSCTLLALLGLVNDKVLHNILWIVGITIYNMIRFHLISSFPFLFSFLSLFVWERTTLSPKTDFRGLLAHYLGA